MPNGCMSLSVCAIDMPGLLVLRTIWTIGTHFGDWCGCACQSRLPAVQSGKWYEKAAEQRDAKAQAALERLEEYREDEP